MRLGGLGVFSATAWNGAAILDRFTVQIIRSLRLAAYAAYARAQQLEEPSGTASKSLGWRDMGQEAPT